MRAIRLLRPRTVHALRQYNTCSSNHPIEFTNEQIGRLYTVESDATKALKQKETLPKPYAAQLDTLQECTWLCRAPLVEAVHCLKAVRPTFPSIRMVLWGQMGTGKTITLNQLVHAAFQQKWVVWQVPRVLTWTRVIRDIQVNAIRKHRIDTPEHAVNFLTLFKSQNQHIWQTLGELKTERQYEWSNVERTPQGSALTDVVEMGILAPFSACDCVGVLGRELRRHATEGKMKLLVAVDQANSLYGNRTMIKKSDFTKALPEEVSLVVHMRRFFEKNWTNGACVLVADKAEFSKIKENLDFPLNTPLELFREEGFEAIDPFIPIETTHYTKAEADALYQYYLEKKWISSAKGRTDEAREQMYYLSGSNPYLYERLCAFN
ncbi:unnamed protein product [Bursaphelenchus xylophilus]|uniref:Small ribosomal subunit protein mS29 n=1 Tax=Bursaphelenchus xylophilus TaxID=6326 RepID=A0A1I7S8J9_BURXY|nr:unnamed protein product [Bursaphelenchus xylophilus]CAG9089601.1 unnamed protein product [Bursaphelenchus xylophilus]